MNKLTGIVGTAVIAYSLYAYQPELVILEGSHGLYDTSFTEMIKLNGPEAEYEGEVLADRIDTKIDDMPDDQGFVSIYKDVSESGGVVKYVTNAISDEMKDTADDAMDSCQDMVNESLNEIYDAF